MTNPVEDATRAASAKWQAAFNSGDPAGCAACYETDATMVATPFGRYRGRSEIEAFWSMLIEDGFAEVGYIDPKIEALDEQSAVLTSKWTMNKAQGVITRELWALQPDGSMLLRDDHFEALG